MVATPVAVGAVVAVAAAVAAVSVVEWCLEKKASNAWFAALSSS